MTLTTNRLMANLRRPLIRSIGSYISEYLAEQKDGKPLDRLLHISSVKVDKQHKLMFFLLYFITNERVT